MTDEMFLALLQQLGDDAKTVAIIYLVLDYGWGFLFLFLLTWGVRTVWKSKIWQEPNED